MRGENIYVICAAHLSENWGKRETDSGTDRGKSMNHPPSVCNCVFMTVFCYFDFHPLYSTASWIRIIYWSIDGSCYVHCSFKTSCKIISPVVLLHCLIPSYIIIFKYHYEVTCNIVRCGVAR